MGTPIGSLKVSKGRVSQKINLRDLLGRAPTEFEKDAFVQEALQRIEDRTLDGDDINGDTFTPYSEEYAESKGVSRNSVDLFSDGDMFDSMEDLGSTRDTVNFGIVDGDEAPKAFNHQKGDTLPQREWFGITQEEAEEIIERVSLGELNPNQIEADEADIRTAIRDLLG